MAGSGGYFISCPADVIVALPTTLTGSIGVLGGKPVVVDLLARWGVGTDAVTAGRHARMSSVRARYSDEEWQRLQESLDRIYDDFTSKVAQAADSSGTTSTRSPAAACGRGWTRATAGSSTNSAACDALRRSRASGRACRSTRSCARSRTSRCWPSARPKSSEDPGGVADTPVLGGTSGSLADLLGALGLSPAAFLLMPPIALR